MYHSACILVNVQESIQYIGVERCFNYECSIAVMRTYVYLLQIVVIEVARPTTSREHQTSSACEQSEDRCAKELI